jgi:hypothetical protein
VGGLAGGGRDGPSFSIKAIGSCLRRGRRVCRLYSIRTSLSPRKYYRVWCLCVGSQSGGSG